ncbi:5-aminolevulinate synthase, mitochondrial [Clarias magur]|uniref:5-aminolevulinate synthase, mitochondrial n=1 Tax=Clarias magur TaxID=1594786 RepID=A0A8J4TPS6_CLAMG|nr:5-aminolevulinate synthase, mitochondrial [Clarias magur]
MLHYDDTRLLEFQSHKALTLKTPSANDRGKILIPVKSDQEPELLFLLCRKTRGGKV